MTPAIQDSVNNPYHATTIPTQGEFHPKHGKGGDNDKEKDASIPLSSSPRVLVPNALIRVQDSGIGIAPEQLHQIFQMFVQVETSTPPPSKSNLIEPVNTSAKRILVVDDNRDSAITFTMLLSLTGNETQTAFDGVQALETAATFRPDVIRFGLLFCKKWCCPTHRDNGT